MRNQDKMFLSVIQDPTLVKLYEYDPNEYEDIQDGLNSNSPVIVAIAKIVSGLNGSLDPTSFKNLYNEVFSYLNTNLMS